MMFAKLSVLSIASLALSISAEDFDSSCGDFDQIIEEVNNASTTWKAGRNFGPGISCEYIKGLLGSRKTPPDAPKGPETLITYSGVELPDEFDARKQWPNCPTVSSILDQSNCGSCWGCQPYEIPPCEHGGTNGTLPPCKGITHGPSCKHKCTNPNYKTSFANDHKKVAEAIIYYSIESVEEDMLKNGPVTAEFDVYEDFIHYKSGVYHHASGKRLDGHAARVLGWGTENGTPYWLAANSWNKDWGDKGIFKIRRGTNECGFENAFRSGSFVKQ